MDDQTAAPIAAESAAAPVTESAPVTPSDRLARMSPAESAEWRKSGTVPGLEAPPGSQGVSSQGDGDSGDVGEDHSAETETPAVTAKPVVDAAASAAGKALNRQKQTAQQRINDLARDKYRLEGELKSLRESHTSRPAAAAEAPPPAATPAPSSNAGPVEPKEEDFDTYAQFVRATARYETRLAQADQDRTRAEQQGQTERSEIAKAHDTRVATFRAITPDYDDVITNQREVFPTPLLAEAVAGSASAASATMVRIVRLMSCPPVVRTRHAGAARSGRACGSASVRRSAR